MYKNNIDRETGNNDFTPLVKTYYQDLKRYKPMSKEEERKYMIKAQEGDIEARNKILTSNLRFVFDQAKKFRGHNVSIADLIAAGNDGMMKAMEKFDINQDVKFFSYAVWWIRQAMSALIQSNIKKNNVESNFEDNFACYDNSNTFENSYSEDDVNDDDTGLIDDSLDLENKEETEQKEFIVEKLLATLDNRERVVITKYFGIQNHQEEKLEDISKELHITTERVRQIKVDALNRMRSEVFSIQEAEFLF